MDGASTYYFWTKITLKKKIKKLFFRCEPEISVFADITAFAKSITGKERNFLFEPESGF